MLKCIDDLRTNYLKIIAFHSPNKKNLTSLLKSPILFNSRELGFQNNISTNIIKYFQHITYKGVVI